MIRISSFLFIYCITLFTQSWAQNRVDSLRALLETQEQDTTRVYTYLALYQELKYDQPENARILLKEALDLSNALKFKTGKLDALLELGDFLEIGSEYDSSLNVFKHAQTLAEELNNQKGIITAMSGQGNALVSLQKLDQADSIANICLDMAQKGEIDSLIIANCLKIKGTIAFYKGQLDNSLSFDQQSLAFSTRDQKKTAKTLLNIGMIYYRLNDFEKAGEYYQKGLTIAERIDEKRTIALLYDYLSLLKIKLEDYEEARKYSNMAMKHYELVDDKSNIAHIHVNLASIHEKNEEYHQAIEEYQKAALILKETNFPMGECYTLYNLGIAYFNVKDYQKAEAYYLQAKPMSIDLDLLHVNKSLAYRLSELYATQGDFEKAFEYHKEFKVLDDSVFNEAKTSRIAELEEKYQTEQKEQEIELLSAENQIATLELQKQANFRNYLIIAAFLLVLLIGVVYNRYQVKARANAKLKELDHLKTHFFTNISHEFRTPLTLILSPVQKLLQKSNDEESRRSLGLIHRNATRLTELINQLLDLSKLEANKLSLQVSQGNLKEFLKVMSASFESLADTKNILFQLSIDDAPTNAFYDENKLQQILNNMLSNAFKFTPEGQMIQFKAEVVENIVYVSVVDGGPGIAEAEQELVFQRFHQSNTNDPNVTGTGVGLTLSKELALLHKGDITLKSTLGKGATFTLHFPITEQAYTPNQLSETKDQVLENGQSIFDIREVNGQMESTLEPKENMVLIVEDNLDLQNHMASLLTEKFEVKLAVNGREGLEIANEIIPDIIITDLMMPELDGIALSNALKKDEKTSHIPVVLLTAKADRDTKLEGLQTGADDFLTKPFDNDELLTRVDNLILQRKALQAKYAKKITLSPSEVDVASPDEVFIQKALQIVDQNLSNSAFTVELFQQEMAMSRMQLHRKLKGLTNFSASEFIRDLRLQRASDLLSKNGTSVTEVAYSCGFNSLSYFTQCFKEKFGENPSKYHEKVL